MSGLRYDEGKLRFDLVPPRPYVELVKVYTMGATKYIPRNWEKGMKWSRVIAAMFRHIYKFLLGEVYDKESGLHHMAHVAFGCFALMEYGWQTPLKTEFMDLPDRVLQTDGDDYFKLPK